MQNESDTGKCSKRGDVRAQEFINIPVGEYAQDMDGIGVLGGG
jgi:hypothetical protein